MSVDELSLEELLAEVGRRKQAVFGQIAEDVKAAATLNGISNRDVLDLVITQVLGDEVKIYKKRAELSPERKAEVSKNLEKGRAAKAAKNDEPTPEEVVELRARKKK